MRLQYVLNTTYSAHNHGFISNEHLTLPDKIYELSKSRKTFS